MRFGKLRKYIPGWGWRRFARQVRSRGCVLLARLDELDRPILVSGCQRSGTTALTQIISRSPEIGRFPGGPDDELSGAWILSGDIPFDFERRRYCFQTTYLNECNTEYRDRSANFQLVWLLREPSAVVRSMIYNWKRDALDELFRSVGAEHAKHDFARKNSGRRGVGTSPLLKACYSYLGKTSQIIELASVIDSKCLWVGDYDMLVRDPDTFLKGLFTFLDLPILEDASSYVRRSHKAEQESLNLDDQAIVSRICDEIYTSASTLIARSD